MHCQASQICLTDDENSMTVRFMIQDGRERADEDDDVLRGVNMPFEGWRTQHDNCDHDCRVEIDCLHEDCRSYCPARDANKIGYKR